MTPDEDKELEAQYAADPRRYLDEEAETTTETQTQQ